MQPDTFYESPLRRPRLGKAILIALAITCIAGAFSLSQIFIDQPEGSFLVYMLGLGFSLITGIPALIIIWFLDRREREPWWIMTAVILWGGVVATGFALVMNGLSAHALIQGLDRNGFIEYLRLQGLNNEDIRSLLQLPVVIFIGPGLEEIVKGVAVLLLLWLLPNEFNDMRDGILYGALVGWGFNAMETAFYIMNGYADSGVAVYSSQLTSRFVFLGMNSHLIYTALAGAGIGLARQTRSKPGKFFAILGGFTLAILAHMINNGIAIFVIAGMVRLATNTPIDQFSTLPLTVRWVAFAVTHLMVESIAYLLLGLGLYQSARWEQRVIREQLRLEIGVSMTQEEYQLLLSEPPIGMRQSPGFDRKPSRAIVDAQNSLAFRKWDVQQRNRDPDGDGLVQAYRSRIISLRNIGNPY